MAVVVDAIVENGVLRPTQPLPFRENERVRITIESQENWVQQTYGLCGWKSDAQTLQRIALAADDDLEEAS